jgi:hypothetical protein
MAGSYNHATTKKGKLRNPENMRGMVENGGDAYETIEEMYGMIWYLATEVAAFSGNSVESEVEEARSRYIAGLRCSPGVEKEK